MNDDVKKRRLLESFEILRNDAEGNADELGGILCEISGIDSELAIEMWEHLLEENRRKIAVQVEYSYRWEPIASSAYADFKGDRTKLHEKILSRGVLSDALYRYSETWTSALANPIVEAIRKNDLNSADYLFGLLARNKLIVHDSGLCEALKDILEKGVSVKNSEVRGMLESWSKKARGSDQAKFTVTLMKAYGESGIPIDENALLKCSDVLRENAGHNVRPLGDLVCALARSDMAKALNLWESLLLENEAEIVGAEMHYQWSFLLDFTFTNLLRDHEDELCQALLSRKALRAVLYKGFVGWMPNYDQPITYALGIRLTDDADCLFSFLSENNHFLNKQLWEILLAVAKRTQSSCSPVDPQIAQSFIDKWLQTLNESDREKFNAALAAKPRGRRR